MNAEQDFLEADPYFDQKNIPLNTYKNKAPFTSKVVSCKRIVGPQATGETCHIIFNHEGKMPYWEGQSWGVLAPGISEKNGKPHTVRLYSIASSRYGDDMTGNTGSLCVRRATYWDPEMGKDDPAKKGVCSNFLCDTKPGEEVKLTGPSGKVMLMPEADPKTDLIMVATGTGIAPYRAFIRRLFMEKTPAAKAYKGLAWLFLGVANSDAVLYDDEWQAVLKECVVRLPPSAHSVRPSMRTALRTMGRLGKRASHRALARLPSTCVFPYLAGTRTTSSSTTLSRVSRRTRRVAKCTSKTRSRNMRMTFSTASTMARTSTSAASRA